MKVCITFYLTLKRYAKSKNGKTEVHVPYGTSIGDILNMLSIIPGEVGLILLNSDIASKDEKISDGDSLEMFPIFGGG